MLYSYQQITICVAYSCLADFDRDIGYFIGGKYEGRYDFFISAFVIGWAVVLFVFFVFLFAVESKITAEKNWNIAVSLLLYFVWWLYRLRKYLKDIKRTDWSKIVFPFNNDIMSSRFL